MSRRREAMLAGSLVLVLAACGDGQDNAGKGPDGNHSDEPSPEAQAALIFERVRYQPCRRGSVHAGDIHDHSAQSTEAGKALDAWRERTLIANPEQYPLRETLRRGPGWTGRVGWKSTTETFAYTEYGQPVDLTILRTWGKAPRAINQREDPEYMQVDVDFCASVPAYAEVISTTGSAEANWLGVAYRLLWKSTAIADVAAQSGAARITIDPPPASQAGRAVLTRASSDQPWRVQIES